jgi:HD-GYP domain-containing protein (c-di-GMP phosphodiesterase class II)
MVKLSDVLRKAQESETKDKDKPGLMSEAAKAKEASIDIHETKKIYENAIIDLRELMDDVLKGNKIQGERVFNIAEKIVYHLRVDKDTLVSFINIFGYLGETDDYLFSHSINVAILAGGIGLALEDSEKQLLNLCVSSLLHDLGFMKVPEALIKKPAKLNREEFRQFQKPICPNLSRRLSINTMRE